MRNVIFVGVILVFFCVFGAFSGYWFFNHSKSMQETLSNPVIPNIDSQERFVNTLDFEVIPELELDNSNFVLENEEIHNPSNKATPLKQTEKSKPKLAIIMDDMAYPWQVESLHELGLKITPSFFPYSLENQHTPEMAKNEKFYMIHLPMEALHFYQSPHKWLKTGESKEDIEAYICQIKSDFPRVSYINNHTGSKFSASYEDMKNFIEVLQKYGIEFLDSRTTIQTKAPEIYAQMNKPLLSRKIFLDNIDSTKEILNQIKKAINMAKKNGYVIAICHPHKKTFEALKIAKKTLFDEVELVYIKDISKLLKEGNAK